MSGDYTITPWYALYKPIAGMDVGTWGLHWNANADVLDATLKAHSDSLATMGGDGPFLPLAGNKTVTGPVVFNGALSGTAFGTGVNQVLRFTDSGSGQSLASITTAGKRLVFRRPTNALTDFADIQLQRTTSFSGGTLSDINRNLYILNSYGANDTASNHGIVITATSASTGNGYNLPIWCQAIRTDGGKSWLSGGLFHSEDQNALGTLAAGVPNLNSIESSTSANQTDDAFNGNTWGQKGVRKNIHVVFSRANQADTTQAEVTSGIWFTTGTAENYGVTGADTHSNYQSVIAVGINTQIRNMLDVRGAITPTGSSNPVSAVTMNAGHVIDFNGGAALDSPPGRYLQYRSGKLYYVVGGVDRFSIDDSGNVRAAGTITGNVTP